MAARLDVKKMRFGQHVPSDDSSDDEKKENFGAEKKFDPANIDNDDEVVKQNWYNKFADSIGIHHTNSGKTIINLPSSIQLSPEYHMVNTPPTITCMLLDNQRTLLSAILDYEKNTSMKKESRYLKVDVHHNGIRLSEDPGAGKTIVCIALISMKIMPTARPLIYPMKRLDTRKFQSTSLACVKVFPAHRVLPCTVITVSRGVFGQWEDEIERFSNLKVLSICDVNAFRKLYVTINSNIDELKTYDVILIKNGKMTGYCSSSYVEPNNRNKLSVDLYSKFVEMVRGFVFWRVINDDIDMSKLPSPTSQIHAYSTINISATKKKYVFGHLRLNNIPDLYNPWFCMRFPHMNINHVMNSDWTEAMQLRNNRQFIGESLQRVKIHFKLHRVHNREGALINMLGGIIGNPDESREIIEMLNGEAFDDATAKMGIQATSVGDIFRRILGGKHDVRKLYLETLDFIGTLDLNDIDEMGEPPVDEVYHQKHFYEKKPVEYCYPGFEPKMNAVWDKCTTGLKETDVIINRFQTNICEGACVICTTGLNKQDIVIMLCCGKPFHQKCAFATANIRSDFGGRLTCMCPHCKTTLDPREAFTTMNGCNLTELVEFDELVEEPKPAPVVEEALAVDDEEKEVVVNRDPNKATKLDRMVDIVKGTGYYLNVYIPAQYGSAGFVEKPLRPVDQMQSIVFTRFSGSIKKISERLTEEGVAHEVLGGHVNNIRRTLVSFRKGEFKALIINGEKNAAGIDLSFADNLIFMHYIGDDNIARQITGRIDRFGRDFAGYVHFINYNHEGPNYPVIN